MINKKVINSSLLQSHRILFRKINNGLFKFCIIFLAAVAILPLFLIFYYIFKRGLSVIFPNGVTVNWSFFVNLPVPVGEPDGGVANAIVGTFCLLILSSIIAVPLGILVGIFLSEFRKTLISFLVGLSMEVLQGVPSIIIGILVYIWVVQLMKGFSFLSGAIALSLIMLPVIAKTTEETLKLVPSNLKEASLALGAPYYLVVLRIILPAGLSGIITGILISIARISGETAPLLFTAFGNPYINISPIEPIESLPHLIYYYATSPYPDWRSFAWGASLVLIVLVLIANLLAKIATERLKAKF